ncbi:hypothetical protein BLGI_1317 [Brevibacillus laterosporus GI-9]|nr:hypothetical protein BLGI_1317 [Brevibacillus laterosporus GI-9]
MYRLGFLILHAIIDALLRYSIIGIGRLIGKLFYSIFHQKML